MPTKTSVVMQTTDQAQKKSSRSITYIDPNASNTDIKNFVEGMNDLTTQTLTAANRVDSTDILNDTKQQRNIKMSLQDPQTTGTPTEITSVSASQIPTDATEPLYIYFTKPNLFDAANMNVRMPTWQGYFASWYTDDNGYSQIMLSKMVAETGASSIVMNIPENETYAEETITLTITA